MNDNRVNFQGFLALCQERRRMSNNDATLEQCVAEVLAEHPRQQMCNRTLELDLRGRAMLVPLRLWLKVLGALVRSIRFRELALVDWDDDPAVSIIPQIIDHILPLMNSLRRLTLNCWERHSNGIMSALVPHLHASSRITRLTLASKRSSNGGLSEEEFNSLCRVLPDCPSLKSLYFCCKARVANVAQAAATLANALVSSSVTQVYIGRIPRGTFSVDQVFQALAQHDVVFNDESLMLTTDYRTTIHLDRTSSTYVNLTSIVRYVRARNKGSGNNESEEECAASLLARKTHWKTLSLALSTEVYMQDCLRILQTLAAGQRFDSIEFGFRAIPATLVLLLLNEMLPAMTSVSKVAILGGATFSDAEADAVYRRIVESQVSELALSNWNNPISNANAAFRCLRNPSPITKLELHRMPDELLPTLCDALPACRSLRDLVIAYSIHDVDQTINAFSTAVANSSLTSLRIQSNHTTISAGDMLRSLARTDAMRNLDLVCNKSGSDADCTITLDRSRWWKRIVMVEMAANEWSIHLEKANKEYDTPDVLHYLFREKNDVLVPRR